MLVREFYAKIPMSAQYSVLSGKKTLARLML
jgi:hypothetical protein